MEELWLVLALFAAVFGLAYLLYQNGIGAINAKTALLYRGYPRWGKYKNCIRGDFAACQGTIRRVVRLRPGQAYCFEFSGRISKGAVQVEIRNRQNQLLAVLDLHHPQETIAAEPPGRLYVTTRFTKADGTYALSWQPGRARQSQAEPGLTRALTSVLVFAF